MKYFYIISNLDKEYAAKAGFFIKSYLEERGAVCWGKLTAQDGADAENPEGGTHIKKEQVPKQVQCVITIGGDGTMIQAARDLAGLGIPMLGVNRGHLGFLNQVSRQEEMEPVLDALLEDRFQLERRMMLTGTAFHKGKEIFTDIALNEIAVTGSAPLKLSRCRVSVNGEYLNEYAADGVLVATPTGSTAYNLSAGGPVVEPSARIMVLTPVCPHTMNVRSIVFTDRDKIEIETLNGGQVVLFDGDGAVELSEGDSVCVECSGLETVMVKLKKISFMQNLSNHLSRL